MPKPPVEDGLPCPWLHLLGMSLICKGVSGDLLLLLCSCGSVWPEEVSVQPSPAGAYVESYFLLPLV